MSNKSEGFSDAEKAAMKERSKELKAQEKLNKNKEEGEKAALAAIADMADGDRELAGKIHEIIKANAPGLIAKTWYGMPAYADKDGNVICFFQNAGKFKARYSTLGFNDKARLDDGQMWPTAYAVMKLTASEESKIASLIKKAVG